MPGYCFSGVLIIMMFYVDPTLYVCRTLCCSLSNLESLELRENLIKYLPTSLSFLVKLRTLDLGSNLIDELVSSVHVCRPTLDDGFVV